MGGLPPTDLVELVGGRAQRLGAELGTGNKTVLGIAIERRDGMAWSAAAATRAIRENSSARYELRYVSPSGDPRRGGLRELVALIGNERAIRRAARRSGLVPALRHQWAWWIFSALLLALVNAAAAIFTRIASQPSTAQLVSFGLIAASAAAVTIYRVIAREIGPPIGTSATAKLARVLEDDDGVDAQVEHEFRAALLEKLIPEATRTIIVSDLDLLADRTRELVLAYIAHPGRRAAEELWVVFERGRRPRRNEKGSEPLTAPHLTRLRPNPAFGHWWCRQQPLTRNDKVALLVRRDLREPVRDDERLHQRAVADVVATSGKVLAETGEELDVYLQNVEPAVIRAFALLSLAAEVPEPTAISPDDLAAMARGSNARTPAGRLLCNWFPADSRTPAAIDQAMQNVGRDLSSLLDLTQSANPGSGLRIAAPAADAMCEVSRWTRPEYDLPHRDHGHAFWALYWQEQLTTRWSASIGERVVTHLRSLRDPVHARRRLGAATSDSLFGAALDSIETSLALCIGGLSADPQGYETPRPGLIEQARMLLAQQRGAQHRAGSAAFLASAWTAFHLTGDPAIVDTIASATGDFMSDCDEPPEDVLVDLYRELLPVKEATREVLLPSRAAGGEAVLDHARTRAAWFALIARPLGDSNLRSEWLLAAASLADAELLGAMERALAGVESASTSTATVNYLTVVVAAVCVALMKRRGDPVAQPLLDNIRRARAVAVRSMDDDARAERGDFILAGVLRQVDSTVAAMELFVSGRDSASESALRSNLAALEELHVMWHNLELYDLADLTALSRNALMVLAGSKLKGDPQGRESADYLVGIGEAENGTIYRLEADLLVGTARLAGNWEKASVPLVEGALLAIDRGLGSKLCTELGKAVLGTYGASGNERRALLLGFLLDPDRGDAGLLDVDDTEVATTARMLLTSLGSASSPVAVCVRKAIAGRRDQIASLWWRDLVDEELEWFEISEERASAYDRSELLARWQARFWDTTPHEVDDPTTSPPPAYERQTRYLYPWVLGYMLSRDEPADSQYMWEAGRLLASGDASGTGLVYLSAKVAAALESAGFDHDPTKTAAPAPARRAVVRFKRSVSSGQWSPAISKSTFPVVADADVGDPVLDTWSRALRIQLDGIEEASRAFPPGFNRSVYQRLARYDRTHAAQLSERADYWRAADEKLQEERLIQLGSGGRFFEVFWHHFHRVPELPCDVDREAIDIALANSRQNPPAFGPGVGVPPALLFDANGVPATVCAAFVVTGRYVFYDAVDKTAAINDVRSIIDADARANIDGLYQLLIERTDVSEYLKSLYRRQRRRFEQM